MPVIDVNLNPAEKQLRQFGWIAMLALPFLGWLFSGKPTPTTWTAIHNYRIGGMALIGTMAGLSAWLRPSLLKWIFIALSVLTFPIGFVLGEVILLAVYSVAFLPIALAFRLIGRDALDRRTRRDAESYWQTKAQPKGPSSYYRQS